MQSFLFGGPFRVHMGTWIRELYFWHYLPNFVEVSKLVDVLDAGCGRGKYSKIVAQWAPLAQIKGVDLHRQSTWSSVSLPNLTFQEADLTQLNDNNRYDLIISIDTLEHIPGNYRVLEKFLNALQQGGILYLAIPCDSTSPHIFPRKWFKHFHDWEREEHIGEQPTKDELEASLKRLGFHVRYSRYTFTWWGTLAWEIEKLFSWNKVTSRTINIIFIPIYRILALFDLYLPIGHGNNLIIAQKPFVD